MYIQVRIYVCIKCNTTSAVGDESGHIQASEEPMVLQRQSIAISLRDMWRTGTLALPPLASQQRCTLFFRCDNSSSFSTRRAATHATTIISLPARLRSCSGSYMRGSPKVTRTGMRQQVPPSLSSWFLAGIYCLSCSPYGVLLFSLYFPFCSVPLGLSFFKVAPSRTTYRRASDE